MYKIKKISNNVNVINNNNIKYLVIPIIIPLLSIIKNF